MTRTAVSLDLRPLHDASEHLHGFAVHDSFSRFLNHIGSSFQRLADRGRLGADWQPTPATDYRLALDLEAFRTEPMTDAVGLFFYLYSRHKATNSRLVRGDPTQKRVLFLRGFDFQTDIGLGPRQGHGTAVTLGVPDSWGFTRRMMDELDPGVGLLAALAPEDVSFALPDLAQHFDRVDHEAVQRSAIDRLSSFYLNAGRWKVDLAEVLDRIDHVVVYLPSLTESSLWELNLLRERGRARDTTVVFDPEAVRVRGSSAGFDAAFAAHTGGQVRWPSAAVVDETLTAAQWRDRLVENFHVLTPGEFFADRAAVSARVARSRGPDTGRRQEPIPFRFGPAVPARATQFLEDHLHDVVRLTATLVGERRITNLPWCLNVVRLGVFTALLLGREADAGRMAARYAGLTSGLSNSLAAAAADQTAGAADVERIRVVVEDQVAVAEQISFTLLSAGSTEDFSDRRGTAAEVRSEEFGSAAAAVDAFMVKFWASRRD